MSQCPLTTHVYQVDANCGSFHDSGCDGHMYSVASLAMLSISELDLLVRVCGFCFAEIMFDDFGIGLYYIRTMRVLCWIIACLLLD